VARSTASSPDPLLVGTGAAGRLLLAAGGALAALPLAPPQAVSAQAAAAIAPATMIRPLLNIICSFAENDLFPAGVRTGRTHQFNENSRIRN
jgi:hypothetical protein